MGGQGKSTRHRHIQRMRDAYVPYYGRTRVRHRREPSQRIALSARDLIEKQGQVLAHTQHRDRNIDQPSFSKTVFTFEKRATI